MVSPLSPLSMTPATGFHRASADMSVSPMGTTNVPLGRSPVPYRRNTPRRAITHPVPLEPLSFAKVPLSPAPSNPNSAIHSTDSEACLSDPDVDRDFLSRSPSLLTSLIMHQSRIASSRTASPITPFSAEGCFFPPGTARPILRRESTATSSSECGEYQAVVVSAAEVDEPRPTIRHRHSCLKFAVTPRPLQLQPTSSRGLTSPTRPLDSPMQSRRSSRSDLSDAGNRVDEEDEDEDQNDDQDQEVTTPGFGSDFGSDSDAGYREDSEDGFTSDEEVLSLGVGSSSRSRRWRPHLAQWTAPPAPILSTPRSRAAQLADCPSTTDDGEPGRARTRIRIHDEDVHYRPSKPTRHHSPPPQIRRAIESGRPAPPAARSPSAAELCRRRTGVSRSPISRSPYPSFGSNMPSAARGWKSDDGKSMRPERLIVDVVAEHLDTLQLGSRLAPSRSAAAVSTSTATTRSCVKFQVGERELSQLREGRQHREERSKRHGCWRNRSPKHSNSNASTGPPRSFRLARRDSAPAKIDEVHVLASAEASACPRRGLKHVLRTARAY